MTSLRLLTLFATSLAKRSSKTIFKRCQYKSGCVNLLKRSLRDTICSCEERINVQLSIGSLLVWMHKIKFEELELNGKTKLTISLQRRILRRMFSLNFIVFIRGQLTSLITVLVVLNSITKFLL